MAKPASDTAGPDYGRLRQLILADIVVGRLAPGSRLNASELASHYRTSATPVREALQQLQGEGMVIFTPNRGARVRALDERFIRSIFDIREQIEPFLAAWFVRHHSAEQFSKLEVVQSQYEEATARGSAARVRVLNRRFHHLIYDGHYNREALAAAYRHSDLIVALHGRFELSRSRMFAICREHRAIIEAIRSEDEAKTARAVTEHVRNAGQFLIEAMRADEHTRTDKPITAKDKLPDRDGGTSATLSSPAKGPIQTNYNRLRDQICADIVEGQLVSGSRLKISELAKRYARSAITIREALHQLQGEGIVIITPNRGARVRSIDEAFVRNIHEIRAIIEPYLILWFARHHTPEQLKDLELAQRDYDESAAHGDANAWNGHDGRFHSICYDSHFNVEAVAILRRQNDLLRVLVRRFPISRARALRACEEHWALIEAIRREDEEAARAILTQHAKNSGQHLVERILAGESAKVPIAVDAPQEATENAPTAAI